MEQEFAFTPTQRLMFVAGQFIVAKVMLCFKYIREKRSDMEEMREMHKEKMEAIEKQNELLEKKKPAPVQQTTVRQEPPKVTVVQKQPEPIVNKTENVPNSNVTVKTDTPKSSEAVSDAKIISETPNKKNEIVTPTLEDVLEGDDEENDDDESDNDNDNDGNGNDIPE